MKKLLIALVSVALVVCTVFTGAGLGVIFGSIDWEELGDHFNKDKEMCTLTIVTTEGGAVSGAQSEYEKGTLINLSAVPDAGYLFAGWYGAGNAYLSTAKNYSFTIEKDTVLNANFATRPEDMEGEKISYDELFDCSQDFSFIIHCDREDAETYLINNLRIVDSDVIGTEWEDHEDANADFVVERIEGTNEYRISPAEDRPYDAGATYVASLPMEEDAEEPEGNFVTEDNTSDTMNFTIQKEETETVEYQSGIRYLIDSENGSLDQIKEIVDDGLAEGDPGDRMDYVVVFGSFTAAAGDIICVYDGEKDEDGNPVLDENSFFGKIIRLESQGSNTVVFYGLPELAEIYSQLDIYNAGDVDLEEAGAEFDEQTLEEIRYMILTDENFQNYVATAQQTAVNYYAGTEYDVEMLRNQSFADMLTLKITPTIWGNKASINIEAGFNIWLYKKGTNEKVAQLSFKMMFDKTMEFSKKASVSIRKIWFIPVGVSSYDFNVGVVDSEKMTVGVSLSYDTGTDGFNTLDKDAAQEQIIAEFHKLINGKKPMFESIKDVFDKNGYKVESENRTKLFTLTFHVGIVTFTIDTNLYLRFDVGLNLYYTVSSVDKVTVGVRSSGGRPTRYTDVHNSANSSALVFAGKADFRAGIEVDAFISLVGLSKYMRAGIGFEVGGYFTVAGCVNVLAGQYAGFIEMGAYWKADVYYKIFSLSGEWVLAEKSYPLFSYGYEEAIMSYNHAAAIKEGTKKIQMLDKSMSLLSSDVLSVAILNAEDVSVTPGYLTHDSKQYSVDVSFTKNSYLSYDSKTGILSVKNGAPDFFEDTITITVKNKNKSAWTWLSDGKCNTFLPVITVQFSYGDAKAYYDSIDNKMQKEFRRLYRSYEAETVEALRANFDHLINNAIAVPEEYMPIVDGVIGTYMDNLFDTIADYRTAATPITEQQYENKFVYGEADVFGGIISLLREIMNEQEDVDSSTLRSLLEDINKSEVMHATLLEIVYSDACKPITENFAKVNAETKDRVESIVAEYEAAFAGNEKAQQLAEAFRHLLGL